MTKNGQKWSQKGLEVVHKLEIVFKIGTFFKKWPKRGPKMPKLK